VKPHGQFAPAPLTGPVLVSSDGAVQGLPPVGRAPDAEEPQQQVRRVPQRSFLFLQGLAGPFFSRLGEALADHGHRVHRINFNGGDRMYWSAGNASDYRGGARGWPEFLTGRLDALAVTDVVLFGDCRPLHAAAIRVARERGLQVHVFEEGYVRPDYVTLEQGGVNGNSTLARDPEYYLREAASLPPLPDFPSIPSSFNRRVKEDLIYNFSALALTPLFPGYRTHRPWHILHEYAGWAVRLLRRGAERRRSADRLAALRTGGQRYFVFPLQLDCDYQIRVHSHFRRMQPAIEQVLSSFLAHAPADAVLVVKGHPLDNGLVDWERRTLQTARRLGGEGRIVFLESVDIDALVRDAAGLVTVNSTTGTLSLRYGVPTLVMGDAVYDMARITDQNGLDNFWSAPSPPDPAVFDAFRRVLAHRCLIHGGYFSDEGLAMLVEGAAARLEATEPAMPMVRLAAPLRPARAAALPARG
jgi:capsular polysaccharide export protein